MKYLTYLLIGAVLGVSCAMLSYSLGVIIGLFVKGYKSVKK